jgi:hypothetical protein
MYNHCRRAMGLFFPLAVASLLFAAVLCGGVLLGGLMLAAGVVRGVFWLLLLPLKALGLVLFLPFLLLRGLIVGLSLATVGLVLGVIGVVLALALAAAVLVPLLPFLLVAGLVWAVVRSGRRSVAA